MRGHYDTHDGATITIVSGRPSTLVPAMDSTDTREDADLLSRSSAGDTAAFGLLYDRHRRAAFGRAYGILGEPDTAEDVVQDAFFTLWRNAGVYDVERGSVRALLLTIVHHRAIDKIRHRREDFYDTPDVADIADVADGALIAATKEATFWEVRDALLRLPPEQRSVVTLAYVGGYTHDEIARLLGLAPGTVKSRVRLGLNKLRRYLGAGFPNVA